MSTPVSPETAVAKPKVHTERLGLIFTAPFLIIQLIGLSFGTILWAVGALGETSLQSGLIGVTFPLGFLGLLFNPLALVGIIFAIVHVAKKRRVLWNAIAIAAGVAVIVINIFCIISASNAISS